MGSNFRTLSYTSSLLSFCLSLRCRLKIDATVTVKVKVHTLDIAPLRIESLPQKRSGMARVLKGFQFYLHTFYL